MPAIETALTTLLKSDPDVTAIFGSSPMRWYPIQIAQGTAYPAAAYQRLGTPRTRTLDGRSTLAAVWLQLTVQATTYDAAYNAARVLRQTFEGFHGVVNGVRIDRILWLDGESNEKDVESAVFNWFGELRVWHTDTAV